MALRMAMSPIGPHLRLTPIITSLMMFHLILSPFSCIIMQTVRVEMSVLI